MLETAHSLSVDLLAAEVVSAFRSRAIRSILLKGPSITRWLYSDGEHRPYGDCDLLVPPGQAGDAQDVLLSLGFRYGFESSGPGELEEDLFWTRGRDTVDLHVTLHGARANPARVWSALSERVECETVGGCDMDVLTSDARAMQVALHVAHHGRREPVPMRDLERALETLPLDVWERAAVLSDDLDAIPAFAAGLSLLPAGQAIVDRLGIEKDRSVKGLLSAETAPTVAFTIEELRTARGVFAKAVLVVRKAFPNRTYMRLYWPRARRGRLGLVAAHCQRIASKARQLLPALIAWNRARRASR